MTFKVCCPTARVVAIANLRSAEIPSSATDAARMTRPATMRAMLLEATGQALRDAILPLPVPQARQVLIAVRACGVCRTDLHLVDGELPDPKLPIVPGHEIVGRVAAMGEGVAGFAISERSG